MLQDLEAQTKEVEAQRVAFQQQVQAQQKAAAEAILAAQEKAKAEIQQARAQAAEKESAGRGSSIAASPFPIAKRTRAHKVSYAISLGSGSNTVC